MFLSNLFPNFLPKNKINPNFFFSPNSKMVEIPNDLLTTILKKLPSKTLIKFLTVSKSWYCLITTHNFISSHLNYHKSISQLNSKHRLFLLESHSRYSIICYGQPFYRRSFLPTLPGEFSPVAASCDGLTCLFNPKQRNLLLWNPSINKFLHIEPPPLSHAYSFDTFVVAGLGYDSLEDDYKVVLINFARIFVSGVVSPPETPPFAQIYSFKEGNGESVGWKMILLPDMFQLHDLSSVSEACFVNNLIHWIVFRGNIDPVNDNGPGIVEFGGSILTFNPRDDCFGELQLPKVLNEVVDPGLSLAVISDSLAVIHLTGGEELGSKYSAIVWKMEEYGVEGSWNVWYKIRLPQLYGTNSNLWEEEDGKVFITTSLGTLIVFNVNGGKFNVFDGEVAMIGGQAFGYTESLVLLDKFSKSFTAEGTITD